MVRILYWNVRQFSSSKIEGKRKADLQIAADRLSYMLDVIAPKGRIPDVIVIVEITGDSPMEVREPGAVLPSDSSSGNATLTLLSKIREHTKINYCVVPPIPTGSFGKCEAVAVFYNADELVFTGPYIYAVEPGNSRHKVTKALRPIGENLDRMKDYEATWKSHLPAADRTWTGPEGTTIDERKSAADWEHISSMGTAMDFPGPGDRKPFLTRFREVKGGRTVKVFAIHTSPAVAEQATCRISSIPSVKSVGDDEVAVVVGDFNVDSFAECEKGHDANLTFNNTYGPLLDLGYEMLLSPRIPTYTLRYLARKPYCMTHLLPPSAATPFNANGRDPDPQHNVYPRFGYMGSFISEKLSDSGAIDNAFVKYGKNTAATAPEHKTTIINTVVGKPYTQVPAPKYVDAKLTGGYALPSTIEPPIPAAGVDPAASADSFRAYENFGKIHDVSDHLALVFDV